MVISLVCFHHAGGSAGSYTNWARYLPPWIRLLPLDLPGHGGRRGEPLLHDWDAVLQDVQSRLREHTGPMAFFGHSMGGLLALRLARKMTQQGRPPIWLGVAAARRWARPAEPDWRRCPDSMVIARLAELGGTPEIILREPALMAVVLPVIRADLALCAETIAVAPALPLPILAFGGMEDSLAVEELDAWRAETASRFERRLLPGGHFFPVQAPAQLCSCLIATFRPLLNA